ncbi:Snm1 [Carabus blaptoides fortunei]
MSTFSGVMSEIDYISIDNFTGTNLKSHAFFLSHCHTDHMRGLNSRDFEMTLQQNNNTYLYTSNVSRSILEQMFPRLKPWIKELDMYSRNIVDIPVVNKSIVVSLISAAHCPGSVMFLFEESDKTLLYTGDIRIRARELRKCKLLYTSPGMLKRIDHIYLDTTFFKKSYKSFPSRSASVNAICELISDWLGKHPKNQISFLTPGRYAYEHLFMEISKKCGMPVHVDRDKYNIYKCFPEMDAVITLDATKTKIHNYCSGWNWYNNICIQNKEYILHIRPSAFVWSDWDFTNELVRKNAKNTGVCYSTHCSYTETLDILKLLKPVKITACVVPEDVKEEQALDTLIEQILRELKQEDMKENSEIQIEFVNKTNWSALKCESSDQNGTNSEECCEENSDIFNIMDSPELKRKKIA